MPLQRLIVEDMSGQVDEALVLLRKCRTTLVALQAFSDKFADIDCGQWLLVYCAAFLIRAFVMKERGLIEEALTCKKLIVTC